jgi:hypothetical protein
MMALFWFSMIVLLIPKMLGLLRALLTKRIRDGGGGVIGVCASVCAGSRALGAVCARIDADSEPLRIRGIHGPRLGLESRSAATAAALRGRKPGRFTSGMCSQAA